MLLNIIQKELSNQIKYMQSMYIDYRNKITIINQRSEAIETYMRDNKQQFTSSSDILNKKKEPKEAICIFINININEYNKINREITDEIDRIKNFTNGIIDRLEIFKNYTLDERILPLIQERKEKERNRIKNKFKKLNKTHNNENENNSRNNEKEIEKENINSNVKKNNDNKKNENSKNTENHIMAIR